MKLHRLRVESFAAIGNVDVEFGPGLNVLYGPNDLGKSTMARVHPLRLCCCPTRRPIATNMPDGRVGTIRLLRLTFETEAQRIWRVRKQFGKSGLVACLQESKNGRDFDEVGRGRTVDAQAAGDSAMGHS